MEMENFFDDFLCQVQIEEFNDDREDHCEDDGQPDEYTEWQDYYGGDDWDHGQYDGQYDE